MHEKASVRIIFKVVSSTIHKERGTGESEREKEKDLKNFEVLKDFVCSAVSKSSHAYIIRERE